MWRCKKSGTYRLKRPVLRNAGHVWYVDSKGVFSPVLGSL